jgi:hypothetical protein
MLIRQNAWSEKRLLELLKQLEKLNLRVNKKSTKCLDAVLKQ